MPLCPPLLLDVPGQTYDYCGKGELYLSTAIEIIDRLKICSSKSEGVSAS
jgi:hypothetical protein